jgi:hypothetical protein
LRLVIFNAHLLVSEIDISLTLTNNKC